jgi:hypothetical protein
VVEVLEVNHRATKLHHLKGLLFTLTEAHDWIFTHVRKESQPLVLDRLENEVGRLRVKIRRLEERL